MPSTPLGVGSTVVSWWRARAPPTNALLTLSGVEGPQRFRAESRNLFEQRRPKIIFDLTELRMQGAICHRTNINRNKEVKILFGKVIQLTTCANATTRVPNCCVAIKRMMN